jgi:hypothetical protein
MANLNWFGFSFDAFLWVFIILNIANVILQTVKSIATIKCGVWSASVINAVAYGLYTIVVVFMNAEGLGILWKALVIGLANLVGVYIVKRIEIKNRKDKLWKVEATVLRGHTTALHCALVDAEISHNYLENVGKYTLFNIFCNTQEESAKAREILNKFGAKYFVSESKTL